jgi:NAD(P) transhydrogenase subunit alpha
MRIGVPIEVFPGENRVALVPDVIPSLIQAGVEILIQKGAGENAHISDAAFTGSGAIIIDTVENLWEQSNMILKVQTLSSLDPSETDLIQPGSALIGLLQPLVNPGLIQILAEKHITSFSLDAIPRIARAQKMDPLSSMASISGYKASLIAAATIGKFLPMMMTAAQTIPPAKGVILGAGVAGLQAIATARRLGAVVKAFDVREAVKEQVESLGATFVGAGAVDRQAEDARGYARELSSESQQRQHEIVATLVREADFVITTALIPGKPAPLLITEEMVQQMRPGAVIVDIAAEAGGNCSLTQPNAIIETHGITIHGPVNLPSSMPIHASQMYARNLSSFLLHILEGGNLKLDFSDIITRECCLTHDGELLQKESAS